MSDDTTDTPAAPKKKKKGKLLKILGALVVLGGGGAGAGVYAAHAGYLGGHGGGAEAPGPKLVPKSEEKRLSATGGDGGSAGAATPAGTGGDKYASTYYELDKDFTSNLQDSVHFVQVGVAVSTPYDQSVIDNIKTHEIAVRSAILMELGNTTEDQVFTSEGKRQLQVRLVKAINDTLKQKEGFGGVGNVYFTSFVVQ